MHEAQRLEYLEALGITQYLIQNPIDGIPQLPVVPWPVEALPETESVETIVETKAESTVELKPEVDVAEALPQKEVPPKVLEVPEESGVPVLDVNRLKQQDLQHRKAVSKQVVPSQGQVTRFAMMVITLNEHLRILIQLGQYQVSGLSGSEHVMLADLLRVLGYPDWLERNTPKLYRWPLVNNPSIARDKAASKEAMEGFFAGLPVVEKQIFLGRDPVESTGIAIAEETCFLGFSLDELNRDWQQKNMLWRDMNAFIRGKV